MLLIPFVKFFLYGESVPTPHGQSDIDLNVLGWHLLTLSPPTAEVINRCPGRKGVELEGACERKKSEGTYRLRESTEHVKEEESA